MDHNLEVNTVQVLLSLELQFCIKQQTGASSD